MALSSLCIGSSSSFFFFSAPNLRLFSPLLRLSTLGFHRNSFCMAPKVSTATSTEGVMILDSEEDLAVSLAKYTAHLSHKFSEERGSFSLVLSGGSLVKSLRKLVEPPYIDSVEWSKWRVFWVDEKIVPKDHDDCNYKLAYDCFLSQVPILPGNVYAINESLSAEGAADDYETCLRHLVKCGCIATSAATGLPKFDLVLIGIDSNCFHRASQFTAPPFLQEDNGKWVTFIKDSPNSPTDIITLSSPVINSSENMAVVVTSTDKASYPCTSVESSLQWVSPQGELTWFLIRECC